jgi:hypothetical protein
MGDGRCGEEADEVEAVGVGVVEVVLSVCPCMHARIMSVLVFVMLYRIARKRSLSFPKCSDTIELFSR